MTFAVIPELATITYPQIHAVYKDIFRYKGSFEAAAYGIYRSLYKDIELPELSAIEDCIRLKTLLIHTLETSAQDSREFLVAFLPPSTIYQIPSYYSSYLTILPRNEAGEPTIDEKEAREAIIKEGTKTRCECCYQHMVQPCKLYPCNTTICRFCLDHILKKRNVPVCPVCAERPRIELVTLNVSLLNLYKNIKLDCYFSATNAQDAPECNFLKRVMAADRIDPSTCSRIMEQSGISTSGSDEFPNLMTRNAVIFKSQAKDRYDLCVKRLAQAIHDLNDRIKHKDFFTCGCKGSVSSLSKHIVICDSHYAYLKKKRLFLTDSSLNTNPFIIKMHADSSNIIYKFLAKIPGVSSTPQIRGASPSKVSNSPSKNNNFSQQSFINIVDSTIRGLIDERAQLEATYMSRSQFLETSGPSHQHYWRSSSNNISNQSIRESINQLRNSLTESKKYIKGSPRRAPLTTRSRQPSALSECDKKDEPGHPPLRSTFNSPGNRITGSCILQDGGLGYNGSLSTSSPMARSVHLADPPLVEAPTCSTVVPGSFSLGNSTNMTKSPNQLETTKTTNQITIPIKSQHIPTASNSIIASPPRMQRPPSSGVTSLLTPESICTSSTILKDEISAHTQELVSRSNCSHCHALSQRLLSIEQKYFQLRREHYTNIANFRRDLLRRSSADFYKDEIKRKDNEIMNLKRYLLKVHPESCRSFSPPLSGSLDPNMNASQILYESHTPMYRSQLCDNACPSPQRTSSVNMYASICDTSNRSMILKNNTNFTTEIVRLKALLTKQADYPVVKRKLDQVTSENERLSLDVDHLRQLITTKEAYSSELLGILAVKDLEIKNLRNCILELQEETKAKVDAAVMSKQREIDCLKTILATERRNEDLIDIIESKNKEIEQLNHAINLNKMGRPYEEEILRLITKIVQLEDSLIYEWERAQTSVSS